MATQCETDGHDTPFTWKYGLAAPFAPPSVTRHSDVDGHDTPKVSTDRLGIVLAAEGTGAWAAVHDSPDEVSSRPSDPPDVPR